MEPMSLKFTVDTLDTVPEAHRSLYTKADDGTFRLQLDGYEEPAALKSALDKERRAARDASREIAAWKGLGKTPEDIQELLAAQAQADREKLTKAGEFDKLRAQMMEAHTGELSKKDERITTLTKSLERRLVDADATAAIAAAKGVPTLLLPHVRNAVSVIEEDGDFRVRVVDDKGNPRVNGKGEFLSIADLVSEMRQSDVFGRAFEADGTTGGGAQQSRGSTGNNLKGKIDGTEAERTAYFASKYPDLK
jgi:hypothetical protein